MKRKIIDLLKKNENNFISGQKISDELGVSRAAIWKYINAIKEDGYEIESVSRKGYKLIATPDLLTYEEIKDNLSTKYIGRKIIYLDTVGSTNNKAKELAVEGAPEGTIIISEEQTTGRGRLGRNWVSPKYKGIWMSIILRPDINPINVPKITQIAAAAVTKASEDIGIEVKIKWPNDIVLNNKKVCGILTEMSGELIRVNHVIVGMGINVNIDSDDFIDEVKDKATSLKIETGRYIERKVLAAKIMNCFEELYEEFINEESIEKSIKICREKSVLIGKEIRIIERQKEITAEAIDLSEDGKLIVKYEDGKIQEIISSEVSVRGLYGYV
ncbi:biotin--[acetyl-CoA-carboxylase] ligase [Clostridium aestuarii]|uniref:Bifunctional ligase/repressor BirA n=1 Tax=Clostridium aestuarii TaxID=338193 RepID=A0ABT4D247_9CLOT|nr:biotin--[acetyl-CoA-carboxylase] ligase [Clostridium aestuarii]MCY6485321.1 biotin--[acetyl-CoA-carboxylase] ligase [Clostridium aestuarii]